jgi:hypothetical protein
MIPITAFVLLAVLSYISVTYIRHLVLHHQILDHPNDRSSHGDQVAPFLIFLGLPPIWILLSIHAVQLQHAQ